MTGVSIVWGQFCQSQLRLKADKEDKGRHFKSSDLTYRCLHFSQVAAGVATSSPRLTLPLTSPSAVPLCQHTRSRDSNMPLFPS